MEQNIPFGPRGVGSVTHTPNPTSHIPFFCQAFSELSHTQQGPGRERGLFILYNHHPAVRVRSPQSVRCCCGRRLLSASRVPLFLSFSLTDRFFDVAIIASSFTS